jgi:uncharacterized membrane protein
MSETIDNNDHELGRKIGNVIMMAVCVVFLVIVGLFSLQKEYSGNVWAIIASFTAMGIILIIYFRFAKV